MGWRVFAASAVGKHHLDIGLPCQDAFAWHRVGSSLVAVVCDGAGSAAHSEQGATLVANQTVTRLAECLAEKSALAGRQIIDAVAASRQALVEYAAEQQLGLREPACTLVGALIQPEGGWLFHLGDGFALAEYDGQASVISAAENGEYANETYFLSGDDWATRLRLTALPPSPRTLALMSDGPMPFVLNRTRSNLFEPFIVPVKKYLADVAEDEGSAGLAATLADEGTWSITGDDKTLLLALREDTNHQHESASA